MSIEAINATEAFLSDHRLRSMLLTLPDKRRPSYAVTALVCVHLANKHRKDRGHVDETVGQIADVLDLPESTIKTVLNGLHTLGVWVVEARGNQRKGTRRVPAFMATLGGVDPTEQNDENGDQLGGADPDQQENQLGGVATPARRGSDTSSAGYAPQLGGVDPTTPHSPQEVVPKMNPGVGVISRPLTIGAIESPAQLAELARHIIADERPTQPITERLTRSTEAAERWMRALSTAADPHAALREVEPILRWALRHRWWGQKATTVTKLAEHWPDIVAQHAAETAPAVPRPSAGQQSGLSAAQQFMTTRTVETPTIELDPPRKELA